MGVCGEFELPGSYCMYIFKNIGLIKKGGEIKKTLNVAQPSVIKTKTNERKKETTKKL